MSRWTRFALLGVGLALALPQAADSQSDVLTGRVFDPDGAPLAGARVEAVSIDTEITRSALTDRNGRYLIMFPDGGGRYVVRVTYIGMGEVVETVIREAGEEILLTDLAMSISAIPLDGITVRAAAPTPGQGDTGEESLSLSQQMLNRLPLPDLDPNTVAQLAAGVIATDADSLTGLAGFSVAGMSDLLNQVTLDGMMVDGELGVPEEGVRQTRITTSTFDPSRGGFAGGLVSMTSARGGNRAGGALTYRLDDDALQLAASATVNAFTRHHTGGSWGGPIVRNRLFYNTSFQFSRNTRHRFALDAVDPLATQRSGVSADSVGRFLAILENGLAIPVDGQTGAYNQVSDDLRLQGRVDWNAVQRPDASHTLTARVNANLSVQDSTRIRELDLAQRGGETERDSRMASMALTSRFRTNWTHRLNVSYSEGRNEALPFVEMPEGVVRVTSEFADGTRETRSLSFGGNRGMPMESWSRELQMANELSVMVPAGRHLHRLKVGGAVQRSRSHVRSADNLFGTFVYSSLEAFEANRPDRFERSLSERDVETGRVETSFFVGDTWRISHPLELTLGFRWDHTRLDGAPDRNPAVEAAFGRRTDVAPQASRLSPRLGFSYRLSAPREPVRALTGGVGVFAGRTPTTLFSQALRQTGLADAEQRLLCIGAAVPTADWALFMSDPTAVPDACADGGPGQPPALASRAPTVTLIHPDQSLPSSLRVDVGYRTQLGPTLNANVRYMYSMGFGLWRYRDMNIDEERTFLLPEEGRPFYGEPSAIVPGSGAVSMATSRVHPEFGNVYDVTADLRSHAHQVTTSLMGAVSEKTTVMANYTLSFARDQGSAGGGFRGFGGLGGFSLSVPTAASPNDVEWAPGSNDRRHTLNFAVSHAFGRAFELTAMTRLSSGAPFTPIVNRDMNGDGLRNDRAFIFDPVAATDPAVAESMVRILATAPARIQDCLEEQLGTIAGRNSCRNEWTQSLDLRAGIRPDLPRLERRLTVSVDARNVLTGVDHLVHGRDDLRGWGGSRSADPVLLYVRGFDPEASAFRYEVNEGFGQTRRGGNAFRNPFSITVSARMTLGGNPAISNRGFGGIRGMGIRGAGTPGMMRGQAGRAEAGLTRGALEPEAILDAVFANPARAVLARGDSLELTEIQAARIEAVADSMDADFAQRREQLAPLVDALVEAAADGPGQGQRIQEAQRDLLTQVEAVWQQHTAAMARIRTILSDPQWDALPEDLRNAPRGGIPGLRGSGARPGAGISGVNLLDRILANPLPVLLELADSLALSPEQVNQVRVISQGLQEKLDQRRASLGRRFDNVRPGEQGRLFAEIQPEIQRSRAEIMDALRAVEAVLTAEQWERLPEAIRNPFRTGARGQERQRVR
jgi:hypothetical protein